ncbi:MAG: PEP-CTERM sorting domain-containing protein [Thermoguttaceae bacterium]|nr:PEP-CTERM sorting domain-containing protein [Thermoguttaceae bacterium]
MNFCKWMAVGLSMATLAICAQQSQADTTTVNGGVWASRWVAGQSIDDAEADLKSAIVTGSEVYGAPVWKLTENVEGSGYYTGTFALYVNLEGDLGAWSNLLYAKSQTINFSPFGTLNDGATWSIAWNRVYSSVDHTGGVWTNSDFLFAGVGESTNTGVKADFFSDSGDPHVLTIGGSPDKQPLGITANAGRTAGTSWLLGVFDLAVSDVVGHGDVVFTIPGTNGYLQGGLDGMGSVQNLTFSTATLYEGDDPFNGTTPLASSNPTFIVPEPGTYAMLCGLGLIGAAWYRRNRKKA